MKYIYEKSNTAKSIVALVYENVCQFETIKNFGITHLLEHILYHSTDSFLDDFDNRCIENNAYTDTNEVVFYIKGLNTEINAVKEKYVTAISNFEITEELFIKEQSIVMQEIDDSFSDSISNSFYNILIKQFGFVTCIGYKQCIANLTFAEVKDFYTKYYNVSKVIEVSDTPSIFNTKNSDNLVISKERCFTMVPKPAIDTNSLSVVCCSDMYKETPTSYYGDFISRMFTSGLKSPMYQEIREKRGLSYFVGGEMLDMGSNFCNLFYTTTSKDKVDAVKETILNVLNNPTTYLTVERFNILKNNLYIKNILKAQDNTEEVDRYFDSSRKNLVCRDNLDVLNYSDMIEYYNTYLHPNTTNYEFFVEGDA